MVCPADSAETGTIRRLTPLDVHHKEFARSFRGYNVDEVDEFLDLVVAEFQRLMRENEDLQSSISDLESRVEHYKGLEETLKNAIVLAQKAADDIKAASLQEAEAIKGKALLDAKKIRDEADSYRRKCCNEVEECISRAMRFNMEMKALLQANLEAVDKSVAGALARLDERMRVQE